MIHSFVEWPCNRSFLVDRLKHGFPVCSGYQYVHERRLATEPLGVQLLLSMEAIGFDPCSRIDDSQTMERHRFSCPAACLKLRGNARRAGSWPESAHEFKVENKGEAAYELSSAENMTFSNEPRHRFSIGNIDFGEGAPLFVIAGPCVIESEGHAKDGGPLDGLRRTSACRSSSNLPTTRPTGHRYSPTGDRG